MKVSIIPMRADILDNLMDSAHVEPEQQARTFRNSHRSLDALRAHLPECLLQPWQLVSQYLADLEAGAGGRGAGRK